MQRNRFREILAGVGLVALMAAGCASGNTAAETTTAPSEPSTTDESETATSPATSTDEPSEAAGETDDQDLESVDTMAGSSPIGAFFQDGGGIDSALAEYRVRVEEKIVICMAAQGFEFAVSAPEVPELDRLQGELTVRQWTEQFGYGISTDFETVATSQAEDPNAQIFFSMSPAERELWAEVLTGEAGIGAALGGGSALPLAEQGCIGEAIIETGGESVIAGMEEFGDAYAEAEDAINDRREMIDAIDAWSRCMSEAGYPDLADLGTPEEMIGERFTAIVAPLVAALGELDQEAARAFIEGDDVALEDFPNLDVDALRTLQADELETALADLTCYELHVRDTFEPLRDDLENGLLTEFSGELEALRTIGS